MINAFFTVTMASVLLDFFVDLSADILNIKAVGQEVPDLLAGIYPPEEYRKSQEYLSIRTRQDRTDRMNGK